MNTKTKDLSVRDFMSTDLVSLQAGATVHDALEEFTANRVSALPIVDRDGRCVGIITVTDLIEVIYEVDDDFVHTDTLSERGQRQLVARLAEAIGSEPVVSHASESVNTINANQSVGEAARMMHREHVHHLPVVDDNQRLVAMLSTMDVIAAITAE